MIAILRRSFRSISKRARDRGAQFISMPRKLNLDTLCSFWPIYHRIRAIISLNDRPAERGRAGPEEGERGVSNFGYNYSAYGRKRTGCEWSFMRTGVERRVWCDAFHGRVLLLLFLLSLFFDVFRLGLGPTNDPIPFPSAEGTRSLGNQGETRRIENGEKKTESRARAPCSQQFLFSNGDYWNRPLRAGPHRVWAMFQLGIPTAAAKEKERGEVEGDREGPRSVKLGPKGSSTPERQAEPRLCVNTASCSTQLLALL